MDALVDAKANVCTPAAQVATIRVMTLAPVRVEVLAMELAKTPANGVAIIVVIIVAIPAATIWRIDNDMLTDTRRAPYN